MGSLGETHAPVSGRRLRSDEDTDAFKFSALALLGSGVNNTRGEKKPQSALS